MSLNCVRWNGLAGVYPNIGIADGVGKPECILILDGRWNGLAGLHPNIRIDDGMG